MAQALITPSKVTAWLDCAHYLTLRHQVDAGEIPAPDRNFGSFAQLLTDKGLQHESDCLSEYRAQGKSIFEVPRANEKERFADWVSRIGNPLNDDWDVIYQMPLIHNGIRGIADFLVRVQDPDTGAVAYEPVDAKLARKAAKPGHVLQLCFYADAVEALTGVRPTSMHLWLGSGVQETLNVNEFGPYWRRLRGQLATALAAGPSEGTVAELCDHCQFCEFSARCEQQWRAEDSLQFVAGIRKPDRSALNAAGVGTLGQLAEHDGPCATVNPKRLSRLVDQAALQVEARRAPESSPPFRLIDPGDDPIWGHGLEQLPQPDDGDVFLDFEGHPFWRADTGLFFLFGLLEQDGNRQWSYREWWAHNLVEESDAVSELINHIEERRRMYPSMHVYHYNHTERSSLEALTATHGVAEAELARQIETGLFVDLYPVSRNAIQAGTESYGLKHLERLTTFTRGHDIDKGAGAVVEYERYMQDHDPARLAPIASYNEDDVRATRALRDWLVEQRSHETPWRDAVLEADPGYPELDERIAALHAYEPGTAEHFLGDVLGYWTREWWAYLGPKKAQLQADPPDLLDDPEVIAGLRPTGLIPKSGMQKAARYRFSFPPQALDGFTKPTSSSFYLLPDGGKSYASIEQLDRDSCDLNLVWSDEKAELGYLPEALVLHDWVPVKPKADALGEFAARLLDPDGATPNPVTLALLKRDLPAFLHGAGPVGGAFTDSLIDMTEWVCALDGSYVAIQGPPGAGKTYTAAHLVHTLISAGKRVGLTAMSNAAIDNLLKACLQVFDDADEPALANPVRKIVKDAPTLPGVTYGQITRCAQPGFNIVAGTPWLFASQAMRDSPVDVLLIDEAGQLALADALAASVSAKNLILLGDPLQLEQVSQADHPNGSGRSALGHVLGDDTTMPADRGVFLSQSWRMHPDICRFISDEIYQGRLTSHPSCDRQSTVEGTGLRWLRAHHSGNSTSSIEEADLIAAEITRLMGTPWTDRHGVQRALTPADFMVVAPFNDQRTTIRERLQEDSGIADVPVGTVDKFQGQEAAVVFFSMATSSAEFMTRGPEFLFSRNRFNVAISRARCLAYLVCTNELLDTRARDVDDMRLISTLNAFVEHVVHAHFGKPLHGPGFEHHL